MFMELFVNNATLRIDLGESLTKLIKFGLSLALSIVDNATKIVFKLFVLADISSLELID